MNNPRRFIILVLLISITPFSFSKPDSLLFKIESSKGDTLILNSVFEQIAAQEHITDSSYDTICLAFIKAAKSINWENGILKGNSIAGTRYYYRGNFDYAIKYFEENIQTILQSRSNQSYLANAYKMLAGAYFNKGESEKAISEAQKAVNIYKELKDSVGWAKTINLLGGIYWNLGKLDSASAHIYKALKLRESIHDSLGVAHSYNNIGLIYDTQGKQDEALQMYSQALDIYERLNNEIGISRASNNIAIILKNKKRYTESLEMFQKSLKIDTKRNNIDDQGKTLSNMGELYLDIGNPRMSINHLERAKLAFKKSKNENGLAAVLLNLGRSYLALEDYSNSKSSYFKALNLAQKLNSLEWQKEAHEGIYQTFKKLGDYKNALTHLEKYKTFDDSLKSISNLNTIDQLKIEYETVKKENQITLLQKSNELNKIRLEKQKSINLFLLAVSALIGIILFILYLYQKKLKKDKILLQEKNSEILIQKEEIETQRDMLEINFNELNQHKTALAQQSERIEYQNKQLAYANHRITEGLEYASVIQQSLFSNPADLEMFFKAQAMLYLPKDYVGGDLYWHHTTDDMVLFTLADCTGHGVAGAFMSIMAISILKDAVAIHQLNEPNEIASYLYQELVKSNATPFDSNLVLGIDFIVCKYIKGTNKLKFAGNKFSFEYFDSSHNHSTIKPTRKIDKKLGVLNFENQELDISQKGKLFFFSDGFKDQISEVKHRKIGRNEIITQLSDTIEQPVEAQVKHMETFMNRWKGNYEQIDDATLLAIEI